jgi:hypothetical protein
MISEIIAVSDYPSISPTPSTISRLCASEFQLSSSAETIPSSQWPSPWSLSRAPAVRQPACTKSTSERQPAVWAATVCATERTSSPAQHGSRSTKAQDSFSINTVSSAGGTVVRSPRTGAVYRSSRHERRQRWNFQWRKL